VQELQGGQDRICLNVNPDRPGSAYGYVDMGGWVGGQAEYVLVPVCGLEPAEVPGPDQALEKILDLTMLWTSSPRASMGRSPRASASAPRLYRRSRAGGLAAGASAQLLGAAVVIVGDLNEDRLAQAAASALRPSMSPRAIPGIRSSS
jgi:glutathione-independent formaldehyde dehydrogenase